MRKNLRGSPFYPVNVLEGSSVKLKAQWTFSFGMISTLFARMRFVSPRLSHNHYVLLLSTGAFFRQYKIQGWEKSGFFGVIQQRDNLLLYTKKVSKWLDDVYEFIFRWDFSKGFSTTVNMRVLTPCWWFHRNMSHESWRSLFLELLKQWLCNLPLFFNNQRKLWSL